jgi:hypothetical protein
MEGILTNCGVRGCFTGVVMLLNEPPPLRKFDSILTGEGGLNDFVLSPSKRMCNAFKMFE